MHDNYSVEARRFGLVSSALTALLILLYAIALTAGLLTLESPDDPIGDPLFTILEILIIALVPAMVAMMVAVHAWTPSPLKIYSLTAVVFMAMLGVVTSALHFFIAVSVRQVEYQALPWWPLIVEFRWPSVAYIFDILAWDLFFPVSVLFAALVFRGHGLTAWIRRSLLASGILALAGLSGVSSGNMMLRNIGIVGYVGVFFVVAVLLFVLFYRTAAPR